MMRQLPIKLLALVEAHTVTGPVKNLLEFARLARDENPCVETTLATYVRADVVSNSFITAAQTAGIPVRVMHEARRFDPQVITQIKHLLQEIKPDIIQTHSVKSHFLVRLSGLWRRAAWVAFHHGYTATDWKVRGYNQLDRWSLRRPQRIVTMNQSFARELKQRGVAQPRITILHNAIHSDWANVVRKMDSQSLRNEFGIAPNERMILSIGRLSHEKAHLDLAHALAQLKASHNCKLVIVGDGPERSQLERTAESLGIKHLIVFAGQQSNVARFYAAADVFALPSHSEGSPNVLLEAMAAELPIVATAVGGVTEIVTNNESALLVPPRNPQALAESLAQILSNAGIAKQLSTNAHRIVRTHYTPEARVNALLEMYEQLCATAASISFDFALQGGKG